MASTKKPMSPSEFFAKIYGDKTKDSDSNDSAADTSSASTPQPPWSPAAVFPPPSLLFGANWPSSLWPTGESAAAQLYQHLELPPALTALSISINYNPLPTKIITTTLQANHSPLPD